MNEENPSQMRTSGLKKAPVCAQYRNLNITRVKGQPALKNTGSIRTSGNFSSRMSTGFATPLLGEAGSAEVGGLIQSRNKEKGDMQDLNKKLAGYIEHARMADAKCNAMAQQLEIERNKKMFDPQELKDTYDQEILCLRKCISELEAEKADLAPKIATFTDKVNDMGDMHDKLELHIKDYCNQLERINDENGHMKGDIQCLRNKLALKEDQLNKLNDKCKKLEADRDDDRNNLQEETRLRCEAEFQHMDAMENYQFQINLLEAENEEYKKLMKSDNTNIDMTNMLEGAMKDFVAGLQQDNEALLDNIKAEYQIKYDAKMQALQTGQNRENLELMKLQTEINKLRTRNSENGPKLQDLEAKLRAMEAKYATLMRELNEEKDDHDGTRITKDGKIADLEEQLRQLQKHLDQVLDSKCNLECEIYTYRKLLDHEDNYMRGFVDQSTGARNEGANALADMVNQSSSSGGSSQNAGGSGGSFSIQQSGGGYGSGVSKRSIFGHFGMHFQQQSSGGHGQGGRGGGGYSSETYTVGGGGGGGGSKSVDISKTEQQEDTKQEESSEKSKTVATLIKEIETTSASETETSTVIQQEQPSVVSTAEENTNVKQDTKTEESVSKKDDQSFPAGTSSVTSELVSAPAAGSDSNISQTPESDSKTMQSAGVAEETTKAQTPEDVGQAVTSPNQPDAHSTIQTEVTSSENQIPPNKPIEPETTLDNKPEDDTHTKEPEEPTESSSTDDTKVPHGSSPTSSAKEVSSPVKINDVSISAQSSIHTHEEKSPEEALQSNTTEIVSSDKPETSPVSTTEIISNVETVQINGIESPTKLEDSSVTNKADNELILTDNKDKVTSNGIDTLSTKAEDNTDNKPKSAMENTMTTNARLTIKRTSKGKVQFVDADLGGDYVCLHNTDKDSINLKGYKISRFTNANDRKNTEVASYSFGDIQLHAGERVKIYSKDTRSSKMDKDTNNFTMNYSSWGSQMTGCYALMDGKAVERACMSYETKM